MSQKFRRRIPAFCLILLAGAAGLLVLRPWSWVQIGNGYRMERETYELLRSRANSDEAVAEMDARYRVLFALGYEEKMIGFCDMAGFRRSLREENKRRLKAIETGQAVYGPAEFTAIDYLDYIAGNLFLRLPEALDGSALNVTEEDMRTYYEEHKEALFRAPDRVEVQFFELPGGESGRTSQIQLEIEAGTDFEDIAGRYGPGVTLEIKRDTITYSRYRTLYAAAFETKPGAVGGPVQTDGGIIFFKCLRVEPGKLFSYDEVSLNVREYVQKQMFDQFLREEAAKLLT